MLVLCYMANWKKWGGCRYERSYIYVVCIYRFLYTPPIYRLYIGGCYIYVCCYLYIFLYTCISDIYYIQKIPVKII